MRVAVRVVLLALALLGCGGAPCADGCEAHGGGWYECAAPAAPPQRAQSCAMQGSGQCREWYCWATP